jgi:oligopeptide transport system ATP-binding protein
MSLIWITHDLGVVAGLVDRVFVMYAGLLVEKAPVDVLYERPKHPYSNALLRSIPSVEGNPGEDLASIEGLPPDLLEEPIGCPFAPRCDFVNEYCWDHMPPLISVEPDHEVACWVDIRTKELRPQVGEVSYE